MNESRLKRLEERARDKKHRQIQQRADFRSFLKRLDHAKKREFFELVLAQAPELLPPWPHSESPFSLPDRDARVIQWLAELSAMHVEYDDLADGFLQQLAREFKKHSTRYHSDATLTTIEHS